LPYFFRFDAAQIRSAPHHGIEEPRRTCTALRRRLTFPPDVVLIVLIKLTILIAITIVVAVIVAVILIVLLPSTHWRLLTRGRHGLRRVVPCAADGRTGVAYAVRTEPLAVWDSGEGRAEARMVVRVIALQDVCECVCVLTNRGRTHLVACERVPVVLVAYQALLWRVELSGVSWQVRVLLVGCYEEERCILTCRDTVRRTYISTCVT
jgi:hypothetical protein